MIITLTPEDLIKRCLWNKYAKFVLKTKDSSKLEKIIKENKSFILNENDAYVIGLLRIVETENLIHRLKIDINDILEARSIVYDEEGKQRILINKSSILNELIEFKNHFPESYCPPDYFAKQIKDVNKYIADKIKDIDKLEVIQLTRKINNQNKKMTYLPSSAVSKMFKMNTD